MKIAILSDFHLGYERFKEDAFIQAQDALQSAAESADMLLIPGDIFDMRNPKPEVLAEAINLFRNISRRNWQAKAELSKGTAHTSVPIIAIPGTHERRARDAEDPVDLLHLAGLLIDVSDSTAIVSKGDERVAVTGIGGISEERFKDELAARNPKTIPGAFNVLLFHQSIYELLPFNSAFIHMDEFPKGFDLYVNGHIHNRLALDLHGTKLLIPGSTVLTQLKEAEQEAKGFYIFDTADRSYEFRQISCRRFTLQRVNIDGKEPKAIITEIRQCIQKEISVSSAMPVIRVVVDGKIKKGFRKSDINFSEIAKEYADKAIVEIANKGAQDGETVNVHTISEPNVSVRDLGLGIFLEKLKENGYSFKMNPTELFDLLSADGNKEKNVKKAIEVLLEESKSNKG